MSILLAISSKNHITPVSGLKSIGMLNGNIKNSSATGVLLKNLGGPFLKMKRNPILSGFFTREGLRKLDIYMLDKGFMTKYKITFRNFPEKRDGKLYIVRVYDLPNNWEKLSYTESADKMMNIRKNIKEMGKEKNDMTVFSFWPDVITLKDRSSPLEIIDNLEIDRREFEARTILICVDKPNQTESLYGFPPAFTHGFATINTNGGCCKKNKTFLNSKEINFQCSNDCETFAELIRYLCSFLKINMKNIKHILYPLKKNELKKHQDSRLLSNLKQSCRTLSLDEPVCIAGLTPDDNFFVIKDSGSVTPGIIGKDENLFAFSTEISALDMLMPKRDKNKDFFPGRDETVIINTNTMKLKIHDQFQRFSL